MKQKEKDVGIKTAIIVTLLLCTIAEYVIISVQQKQIRSLRQALPYLLPGEQIDYFDLIDSRKGKVDRVTLEQDPVSLIFIFQRPCSPCDKNILFWNKLAAQFGNRVKVYGLILNDYGGYLQDLEKLGKLDFKLYCPEDVELFSDQLKVRTNAAQTLVYSKGVRYVKSGELEGEDIFRLVDLIIKEVEKNA